MLLTGNQLSQLLPRPFTKRTKDLALPVRTVVVTLNVTLSGAKSLTPLALRFFSRRWRLQNDTSLILFSAISNFLTYAKASSLVVTSPAAWASRTA